MHVVWARLGLRTAHGQGAQSNEQHCGGGNDRARSDRGENLSQLLEPDTTARRP